jgi:predicted ATPase
MGFDPERLGAALTGSGLLVVPAPADRLSAEDRKLLQMAAVIGRRFDPSLLSAVESGFGDVAGKLRVLQELDFVQRDPQSGDFEFKHVLMRDALYDNLLSALRAELHFKVGSAIERRAATRLSEVVETLAHHFSLSGRHNKAFRYCSLSGTKCLEIYCSRRRRGIFASR